MPAAPGVPFGFCFDLLSVSLSFFELQVPSKAASWTAVNLKVAAAAQALILCPNICGQGGGVTGYKAW